MSEYGAESRPDVGAVVSELAKMLVTGGGAELHLTDVLEYAARAVPHSDHAGLTLVRGNTAPKTVAATSEVAAALDALQYEAGEGPCLDALVEDSVCRSDDLLTERRWPRFIAAAVESTPVRSMLGIRLRLDDEHRAALNLYSESPSSIDETDLVIATLFATHLSALLQRDLSRQKVTTLELALGTSRQIGAAMGVLMTRDLLTFDEAFDRLRAASQRLHRKLRDVALDVVDRGELPN